MFCLCWHLIGGSMTWGARAHEDTRAPTVAFIPRPLHRSVGGAPPRRMLLVEEPHHLRRGVGSFGVGVGAGAAPSRPGVPEAVDGPLLHYGATVGVTLGGAGVSVTVGDLPLSHRNRRDRLARRDTAARSAVHRPVVREQLSGVARVYGCVAIPVEHDHGYAYLGATGGGLLMRVRSATALHGG